MVTSVFFFCCLPFKAQANLSVQALEERLKKLEGKTETDSVELALQALHRTLDKSRFDPEDAVMDLESLVKVAKINNHAKAREYECVLDEVQKHSKSLNQKSLRDLLVALVGDPIKSKVLEKTHKLLKHTTPENRSTSFPSWRRYNNRFTYHQGGSRDNWAVVVSRQAVRLPRLPIVACVLPRVIFAGQLSISLKIALSFRI